MGPESQPDDPLLHITVLDPATALSLSDIELDGLEDSEARPNGVRTIVLAQHEKIRGLLGMLERKATELMAATAPNGSDREGTRQLALVLCLVMASHIDFENRALTAALEALGADGAQRAERLRNEHAEQLQLLHAYADALAQGAGSPAELAWAAKRLVAFIREDMRDEEATMLNANLFRGAKSASSG